MTTAQALTITRLSEEWGETFTAQSTRTDGSVIVGRASDDPYYEPHPVRYAVYTDGIARELDRDGYERDDES